MLKLGEFNPRHVVGLSTLALVIAGLGVVGSLTSGARHMAAAPGLSAAQTIAGDVASDLLAKVKQLPANAFGSAKALLPNQPSAGGSPADAQSRASESKFWSEQEWRLASKAVADFRSSGGKAQVKESVKDLSALTWRPPEEIAGKAPQKPQ